MPACTHGYAFWSAATAAHWLLLTVGQLLFGYVVANAVPFFADFQAFLGALMGAPFVFGFLVGPASLNRRSDGSLGGLVVEKCKFLQESNCKGMCLNSCKLPAQELFSELGLPLRVSPNFETQECQWSFGEVAPPPDEDPTWPKGLSLIHI